MSSESSSTSCAMTSSKRTRSRSPPCPSESPSDQADTPPAFLNWATAFLQAAGMDGHIFCAPLKDPLVTRLPFFVGEHDGFETQI